MTRINMHDAVNDARQWHREPGQPDNGRHPFQPELVAFCGAELIETYDPDAIGGPVTYFYCLKMGGLDSDFHNNGLVSDVSLLHKNSGKFEIVARGQGAEELVASLEMKAGCFHD